MKRKGRNLAIVACVLAAVAISACFLDAVRDNANDPKADNYKGNGGGGDIADYAVFVNSTTGNDSNLGTQPAQPVASIQAAIPKAKAGDKIAVAQGTYNTNVDIEIGGIELYGGFPVDSWKESTRNPELNETIINDTRTAGGDDPYMSSNAGPIGPIKIIGNSSSQTVIDGFKITGPKGTFTCAIYIETDQVTGYNANIINCVIDGGTSNSTGIQKTYGIIVRDTNGNNADYNISIQQNYILGGNVSSNVAGAATYGIYAISSTGTDNIVLNIWNNVIIGGNATDPDFPSVAMLNSYGIYLRYIKAVILNNTIDGGYAYGMAGSYATGIYIDYMIWGKSPDIINNLIINLFSMEDRGIAEYGGAANSRPQVLSNNDVVGDYLFVDQDSAINYDSVMYGQFYDTSTSDPLTPPTADKQSGNINIGAAFASTADGDYHLQVSNANNDIIKAGGQDLSSQFTVDKDGNTRTAQWSIGAYESD